MLHFLVQIAHIACPPHEQIQRILSLPVTALVFVFPALAPELYLRHRNPFLLWFKVTFFSFPLLRKPKGIQRVLNAAATPGLRGFIVDLVKMAWGSRLFAAVSVGLGLPTSLIPQILGQVYAIAMIRGNASLCSTQLITDPLTITRLRVFINLTSQMLLPVSNIQELLPPGTECSFIFTLLHLLFGIVVPSIPVILSKGTLCGPARQGPSKGVIWWIGLSITWAVAVLFTAYA